MSIKKELRIRRRKYSSNVIERNEGSKKSPNWQVFVTPTCKKKEGDKVCEELIKKL